MNHQVIINNSLLHVLIYGYFQHGYEVWFAMQKDTKQFNSSDLIAQKRVFDSIRSRIRGNSFTRPTTISGLSSMFGAKGVYPKIVLLNHDEYFFFKEITNLNFKKLLKLYKKYCNLTGQKPVSKPFNELLNNLRTVETINFLMEKFQNEKETLLVH